MTSSGREGLLPGRGPSPYPFPVPFINRVTSALSAGHHARHGGCGRQSRAGLTDRTFWMMEIVQRGSGVTVSANVRLQLCPCGEVCGAGRTANGRAALSGLGEVSQGSELRAGAVDDRGALAGGSEAHVPCSAPAEGSGACAAHILAHPVGCSAPPSTPTMNYPRRLI